MEAKKSLNQLLTKENEWLLWLYGIGLAGHIIEVTRASMIALTPLTLAVTLGYIVYAMRKEFTWKLGGWIVGLYIITLITEIVGVDTGTIFGPYVYGDVLGWQLFHTPLIIGLLWVFVIMGCISLIQSFTKNKFIQILGTGIGVVLFDYILEPVAIKFGYWKWLVEGIPTQNYIVWGILGLIGAIAYVLLRIKIKNTLPRDYFIVMLVFFIVLRVGVV